MSAEAVRGWVRRDGSNGGTSEQDGAGVVITRDYPGRVVGRFIRNDVYQEALRAAESTLRNAARKK
jgi:hypothetical protein